METEMELRVISEREYPGYKIREDGWLFNISGRAIGGNANGQVRLQHGAGMGSSWHSIAWLVAKTFVPNPNHYLYIRYIDGNKDNLHHTNLEWWPSPIREARKASEIIKLALEGLDVRDIASKVGTSLGYVRKVSADYIKVLEEKDV